MTHGDQQISIRMEERRHAVMRSYVENGITNEKELAKRHGCSVSTIVKDLEYVADRLRTKNLMETKVQQGLALARTEHTFQLATAGYIRSRKDEIEIRTEYKRERCQDCQGTGFKSGKRDEGPWCESCQGTGKLEVEYVTKRVKGKAGDPTFLRIRNDCVRTMAKLQGIYEDDRRQPAIPPPILIQQLVVDTANIPNDLILKGKEVMRQLRIAQAGGGQEDIVVPREDEESENLEEGGSEDGKAD